jgi:hypothetical protein
MTTSCWYDTPLMQIEPKENLSKTIEATEPLDRL